MFETLASARVRRRTLLATVGLSGLTAALASCSVEGPSDAEFTITAAHGATTDHFHHLSYMHFRDLVQEGSDGRIAVRVHPNGVFGGDREVIEHVQLDNLQVGLPSAAPLAAFIPQMNVWEIPFLFESAEHAYATVDSTYGQSILNSAEDHGVVGLAYWDNGFRNLTTRNVEVQGPEDVENLSIRTLENTAHIRAWQAVGANPTPMAFGEVYVGLQQGTIQAQENPLPLIESQRFYEVQQYVVLTQHLYNPSPFLINQRFFESLPAQLRDVVVEAALETRDFSREEGQRADEAALETVRDAGTEIVELEQEQREAFAPAMQEAAEGYIERIVGQEMLEQLHQAVEETV